MSDPFDPYHRWLGVPPEQQPAHYYRLLSLELFEEDRDVISDAAERQMAHVRRYGLGPHTDLSQELLGELARAKACLLDPVKKANYDSRLQSTLKNPTRVVGQPALADQMQPAPVDASSISLSHSNPESSDADAGVSNWQQAIARVARSKYSVVGIAAVAMLAVIAISVLVARSKSSAPAATGVQQRLATDKRQTKDPRPAPTDTSTLTTSSKRSSESPPGASLPTSTTSDIAPPRPLSSAQLVQLSDQSIQVGNELRVQVGLSDDRRKSRSLSFRLANGAPPAARIDPNSGLFTWTPRSEDVSKNHEVTIELVEAATGSVQCTRTFQVEVNAAEVPSEPLAAIPSSKSSVEKPVPKVARVIADRSNEHSQALFDWLETVERDHTALSASYTSMQQKLDKLAGEIRVGEAKYAGLASQAAAIQQSIAATQVRGETVQRQRKAERDPNRRAQFETQLSQLLAELATYQSRYRVLNAQATRVNVALASLKGQFQKTNKELVAINQQYARQLSEWFVRIDPCGSFSEAEYERAARLISDWIVSDPKNVQLGVMRALLQANAGNFHDANSDCQTALSYQRDLPAAVAVRGYVQVRQGKRKQGIRDLNLAFRNDPNSPLILLLRGWAHSVDGNHKDAIADFQKSMSADANNPWAHAYLAQQLAACPDDRRRNGAGAEEVARLACVATSWKSWRCLDALAASHAEQSDFREAISYETKAIEWAHKNAKSECQSRLKLYQAGEAFRLD